MHHVEQVSNNNWQSKEPGSDVLKVHHVHRSQVALYP